MTQPEKHVTTILNYGGGRQTITILILIAKGVFPRPDYVVCADTGREVQTTWDYLEAVARPYCAQHDIEIHVAPHSLSTVDLYGLNGDLLVPAYTPTGKLPKFCSTEWKTRVVKRYVANLTGQPQTWQEHWIGYSSDEKARWQKKRKDSLPVRYPLVELMINSAACEVIIKNAGLPVPNKSSCSICPFRRNEQWRLVRENPVQWQQAIDLDEQIREEDLARGGPGVYLHHSAVPLSEADIDRGTEQAREDQCSLGVCFT